MEQPLIQQEIFVWVISLVIGLPIITVFLGELAERLAAQGNPLAQGIRQVRNYVVPLLALLVILRQVLTITGYETFILTVESLFWIVLMITLLKLLGNLVQLGELNPTAWVNNVPALFFALGRALASLVILYYVLTNLWGVDISSLVTAVGVGSVVIALALQDTLSNLVSGFLLLLDRPFKVGDWIEVNGTWYEVMDVNWRSTRLKGWGSTRASDITYPNGLLGNAVIANYDISAPGGSYQIDYGITFSYDDPPNKVKQALLDMLLNIDAVHKTPPPKVGVRSYQDSGIEYLLRFWFDPWLWFGTMNEVKTQIYYTAKRHGLTFPYPTTTQYRIDLTDVGPVDHREKILATLQKTLLFQNLDQTALELIVNDARLSDYGAGERLVRAGQKDDGFYIIHQGGILLTAEDQTGAEQTIARLSEGDFFGITDILRPNAPSLMSATATSDLQVVIISSEIMPQMLEQNHKLALELNYIVEERQKMIAAIQGIEEEPYQNGRLRSLGL